MEKGIAPTSIVTTEMRHEGDLIVMYKPSLEIVNDHLFKLTYNDPGVWISGDAEDTESDGELGVASYQLTDGASKWACS